MIHPSEEHFTEVYNSYYQDVFRVAFSYLNSVDDSNNVVQDVYIEYYRKPPKEEKNLKSWLLSKAIHRSLDLLRKQKRNKKYLEESHNTNQETSGANIELHEVLDAIKKLPLKYEKVIILFYLDQLDINDISKALSITPSSVKKG